VAPNEWLRPRIGKRAREVPLRSLARVLAAGPLLGCWERAGSVKQNRRGLCRFVRLLPRFGRHQARWHRGARAASLASLSACRGDIASRPGALSPPSRRAARCMRPRRPSISGPASGVPGTGRRGGNDGDERETTAKRWSTGTTRRAAASIVAAVAKPNSPERPRSTRSTHHRQSPVADASIAVLDGPGAKLISSSGDGRRACGCGLLLD
jgi:hypothetical protein